MKQPTLTSEQQEIVDLGDGAYLVTAPPGSGKTEVLVRRGIHLLQQSPGDIYRMLALTYTIRAAGELRSRVGEVIPQDEWWRMTAATFHAFALELLENYGEALGIKKPITLFEDLEDKRDLVLPLLDAAVGAVDSIDRKTWRELFDEIARQKTELIPAEGVGEALVLGGATTLREAYETYEAALASAGGIDYEGMLFKAVELLNADPWVGEHSRRMYRYIFVDEGQEMNRAQYELLRALCGEEFRNVFVVADADQSINAFAGGGPQFLEEFATDFGATACSLSTNFRSAQEIVKTCSNLAAHIKTRPVDAIPMRPATLAPGWVASWSFGDEPSEGAGVAEWVAGLLGDGLPEAWVYEGEDRSLAAEDICIQGRTRYAFDDVVQSLEARKIPLLVRTGEGGLFDSALGRLTYYALRLVENPRDLPTQRRLLAELASPSSVSFDGATTPGGVATAIGALAGVGVVPTSWAGTLSDLAEGRLAGVAVVSALQSIDPVAASTETEASGWKGDRAILQRHWTDYAAATRAPERSVGGFLKILAQLQGAVPDEPGVRVLTPYRARGLGFRVVVVLGMNEGTFPYYLATTDAEIDEERRAVYVAASRAARALVLTRPRIRYNQYGRRFDEKESRFLAEMGLSMEVR
jgi:DNA helicase-2/ATP-dependent DNA helicase PcrA